MAAVPISTRPAAQGPVKVSIEGGKIGLLVRRKDSLGCFSGSIQW